MLCEGDLFFFFSRMDGQMPLRYGTVKLYVFFSAALSIGLSGQHPSIDRKQ